MKRFAKVFLVLTVVSAFGYWAYKQFKKTSSVLGKIHVNADSALKIGVQEIKETLLLDVLTSPKYYFDQASFKDSDDTDKPDQGINLFPYSIVLYTVPKVKNTFFSTFLISDSEAFEIYVQNELEKKSVTIEDLNLEGFHFAKAEKSKMALAWNSEKLVVAFSLELRTKLLQGVFKDILTDGKVIKDKNNPLIEALANSNNHLAFIKDSSRVTINFEDGQALVDGSIRTISPQKFQPELSISALENPSLEVYFDSNFENATNKTELMKTLSEVSFFAKNNLKVDQVLNRTNGFISLDVDGETSQTDTIITYVYNDNFEKVEERTLKQKQVPRIHLNLGAENESLKDYLMKQNVVNGNGIFEPFPLYQIHVKEDATNTNFDTFEGAVSTKEKVTNSFLRVQIDFLRLKQDVAVPMADNYLENLRTFKLSASQKDGNLVRVKGVLTAADPNINILSQLIAKKQQDSVQ